MRSQSTYSLNSMKRWEFWAVLVLSVLLLGLALHGKDRHHKKAITQFISTAQDIQAALDKFAAEHDGGYPPDAVAYRRPLGLNTRYLRWKPEWHIDYEVGDNDNGGHYACLEFCGPEGAAYYEGLCSDARLRRDYPRAEPIPGHRNRIWLIKESAKIITPKPGE